MEDPTIASGPEVLTAIFIDVPNVRVAARENDIRWASLIDVIEREEIKGTALTHAGVYVGMHGRQENITTRLKALRTDFDPSGYHVHYRIGKDIDSWLINDIWMSITRIQERMIRETGTLVYPLRIRHVLVSGDGGYLRAYRSLRGVFGEDLELDLVVYSWSDSLSYEYYRSDAKITYLDSISDLILPAAVS